ncbi:hypothetical protein N7451_009162 [Penicillium sp. IBT 35674x]|nr:hypothetical protein N7451_009162 [Penicillium sp. IBT 35674x]
MLLARNPYGVASIIWCDATQQHAHRGPTAGWTPGAKNYPLKAHHIKRLITHVEKGGVLESHKDVPENVRKELYREEQQKMDKGKRQEVQSAGAGAAHHPISILNVLPAQPSVHGLDVSTPQPAAELTVASPLDIPGLIDVAVKEYGEWQVSNVGDDTLRTAFRHVCDVMLEYGLDLEQVYQDQDPNFFIEKGINLGVARRFVEDIGKWARKAKKAMPVYEIVQAR